ncbi:MAG: YIP1 family protein [Clostridia bacterium]|nr:YIP1 family protein [Clostridia bacterium]
MKKLNRILLIALALIMLLPSVISATVPYSTYTYSIDGEVLDSPDAYVPDQLVNSVSLGLDVKLKNPSDIESDEAGNLYITDKENNRVVVLDNYYEVKYIIDGFVNKHGVDDTFNGPNSSFVVDSGDFKGLYVCDTLNSRLLVFNQDNGEFIREISRPESELFDEKEGYAPVSCVVDKYGRIYVASNVTTQGVIVMTFQGEFINFIGAPKVTISALEALIQMISKSAADQLIFVPTAYNTLDLDKTTGEFVYATIMYSSKEDTDKQQAQLETKETDGSPVRLLNANGADIMNRNGFFAPSGEVAIDDTRVLTGSNAGAPTGPSEITDVASGPNGVWSIVDQKRSKIYTYDRDGNLLYIFGDKGSQLGNLTQAKAITYQGSNIIVLDVTTNSFTVYRRTEYAELLDEAIQLQNEREYDKAAEKWDEVLARNNNFDTAYVEKGKALYRNGNYEEAQQYFKNAFDVENYATVYKELRKQSMEKLFFPLIIGIIAIIWGISLVFKKAAKINKAAATKAGPKTFKEELTFGFHLMFHPFDGFWDLKHEKRGSVRASIIFIVATVVAFIYQSQGQGYYYNPQGTTGSVFGQIFSVLIPFALVIIANWCFTTLFDGEGSLKDIFIAVSYSLFPVPVLVIISTILTNFMVGTEGQITTMIVTVAYIWMGFLMILGLQVTHDYSSGKNILTVIATLVGMVFIMFIAVLFTSLLTKMSTFVTTIISELSYR